MPVRALALTARDPPSPSPARSLPVPFQSLPTPSANPTSRPTPTLAPRAPTSRGQLFSSPPGAPGFPRTPKLPDTLPASRRSPGVIVLAPHVDGLIQVAFGGRLLARALHRGVEGPATDAEPDAARSPRASSLPPTPAPASAAPRAARSAPRSSFPRRSPAWAQEPATATPPVRAGPFCVSADPPGLLSRPRLPGTAWISIG